jgi:hypothetical protein
MVDPVKHDKIEELRKAAFELTPHEQHRLASFIAENVGYVLRAENNDPDAIAYGLLIASAKAIASVLTGTNPDSEQGLLRTEILESLENIEAQH